MDFTAFNGQPLDPSIVIAAGKALSIDLEPEFVTVAKHGKTAWVTLQEANAVAEIDLKSAVVTALRGLGFKDHGASGNAIDASDRDNAIKLCTWTNLFGMYQPDGIASFQVKAQTYLVTANEGDSRDDDESRVSALAHTRSDNKGLEPEGVVVGEHLGRTYAFVGLERTGGIVVYDVKPMSPQFETYVNRRDFSAEYELPDEPGDIGTAGDVGPEGLAFIPFFLSPNGRALLVAANEVSGTTTVYELTGFSF